MIGTTISHYEVLEKLGEGGMGAVFKARDTQLGRHVAIKVLISTTADSADMRARFLQEARAASSLNHPNIITIHDIVAWGDEKTGGDSIVMELVRGQTLGDMIAGGKIPAVDAIRIAMQMADALSAAHNIGIVHRDLKPANVMVTPEGLAKVLDFGLAKLSGDDSGGALAMDAEDDVTRSVHIAAGPKTAAGAIIGTVAYMSPEQAQGRKIDPRSDIFSFGSVVHEMLTGARAFQGKSGLETLAAVLRDDPKSLAEAGAEAPVELQAILARCMKKDPDQRFQQMADVKAALEEIYFATRSGVMSAASGVWTRQAPAKASPSIAVLPFVNMSSDKENDYFSDGLAEEIINALTHVSGLRVTARTSAFVFRGAQQDIRKIGESLNVASVLEGSVRKAGNRVRISVQLINVGDSSNVWSERFDREMTDVFEIQDEISVAIVGHLKTALTGDLNQPIAAVSTVMVVRRFTENLEAYDLYLRGRYELYKMTREGLDAARRLFEQAIRMDPGYALAHDGLASSWFSEGFLGFASPREVMPKAKAAVRKALELDDTVAEAHATLGAVLALYDWDWPGAERELLRSIELNPASPVARDLYSFFFLRPTGRLDEAVTQVQNALSLDPLSILFRVHLGFLHYLQRNFDLSIAQFRKVLEMNPQYYLAHAMMGQVYTQAGKYAEAAACYVQARAADAGSNFVDSLEAMTLAAAGDIAAVRPLLQSIERRAADAYISPVSIAYVYTALGDRESAFELLDQAITDRDPNILGLKSNPIFDSLRSDPRYPGLLAKMQL